MGEFADQLLNEIDQYVEAAMQAVAQGETAQLDTLMGKVETLCKGVLALEKDEGLDYAPQLEQLRDKLDTLQQAMELVRKQVADEIAATNLRQQASRAYRLPEKK